MKNFYELYPDLKQYDSFMLKYTVKDADGNIIKAYKRDDINSEWQDVTESFHREQEIKKLELELKKLELKERLMKRNVEEN